eukprot:5596483-Pleurochrysis_carterae.AAC.3
MPFCNSRCVLALLLCFAAKVTTCAAEERAELVNVRLRAGFHLLKRHVHDGRGASGDRGVVDGYDLVDSQRPEPLAHAGCCKADAAGAQHQTPDSFSRSSLRVVGRDGLVTDQILAKKSVDVLLKELAALVR